MLTLIILIRKKKYDRISIFRAVEIFFSHSWFLGCFHESRLKNRIQWENMYIHLERDYWYYAEVIESAINFVGLHSSSITCMHALCILYSTSSICFDRIVLLHNNKNPLCMPKIKCSKTAKLSAYRENSDSLAGFGLRILSITRTCTERCKLDTYWRIHILF